MARKAFNSHEDFVKAVYDLVKDEYTVLGEYKGNRYPILMRHNICGHEWMITPSNFIRHGTRCPIENGNHKYTTETFKLKLKSVNHNLELIDEYINYHTGVRFRCKIDGYIFKTEPANVLGGSGCPVCAGRKVVTEINDLWTTHPELAKLLENHEDGYKYSFGTHKKLNFVCQICGKIKRCRPYQIYKNNKIIFSCSFCSDGISYPEKFITSILEELNINFDKQLTSSTFKWVDRYRYDFYLSDYNMIIEVHGLQHYEECNLTSRTLAEEQENDKLKKELALNNGINEYVIIDARYSNMEWIKGSIINSKLNKLFDLSNINWNKCDLESSSHLVELICKDWNNLKDIDKLKDKYKLSIDTIRKYLVIGSNNNICTYNNDIDVIKNKKIRDKLSKQVYCHGTGEIFESITYIQDTYGVSGISRACLDKTRTAYGLQWSYLDDLPDNYIRKEITLTFEEYLKKYREDIKKKYIVNQYSLNDIYINTFENMDKIVDIYNYSKGNINSVLNKKRNQAYGYKWYYANDPNQPDKTKIIN